MHILIWSLAAIGLALWSAAAWGVGTLLGLDPNWVGDLKPLVDEIPYAAVIDTWLPGWRELLLATLELTRTMLGWAGGAGVVIVWVVWGVGAAVIAGGAAVCSLIVSLLRRPGAPRTPAAAA
jgi:hypothetical protein